MRQMNKKMVLAACKLSFDGKTDLQIAQTMDLHVSAVSRWRKTRLWQEFERELIDAHKQSLLGAESATLSEG